MSTILLTGGTGTLGRVVRPLLEKAGNEVRVLSRRERPVGESPQSWLRGDLRQGLGVDGAVAGVDAVVHCATGRDDVRATRELVHAAQSAGTPHVVYISIVGIDAIPLGYYRAKLASERIIERSGMPFTILRATQFHDLVAGLFRAQRVSPFLLTPKAEIQPIDVRDVAVRLAELAAGPPQGRVPDLGGPEVLGGRELAREYLRAAGSRRVVLPVRLPGKVFAALAAGHNLAPDNRSSGRTFAEFLREYLPASD